MAELKDILATSPYPAKDLVHVVESSLLPVTITTTDGFVDYANDGGAGTEGNIALWDVVTNATDTSMLPLYSKLDIMLVSDISCTIRDSLLTVDFYIPHPNGDIVLWEDNVTPAKQNTVYAIPLHLMWYVSQDVIDYGIKMRTAISAGTLTISARKLILRG